MAARAKFTRIPKVPDLVSAGIPAEAIPTYCALADYANNRTGECWPKMQTLALTLKRSIRTVQRHLHLLKSCGLVEFMERRRHRGRFSSYLYRIVHITQTTTGHRKRMTKGAPNIRRTKRLKNNPQTPKKEVQDGYWWLFGDASPPREQLAHDEEKFLKREEKANRRREGFEWLFQ